MSQPLTITLAVLIVVVPVAVIVIRYELARRGRIAESRSGLSGLEWRARAVHGVMESERETLPGEVVAALSERLAGLDARKEALAPRPLDDPDLAGDAGRLTRDYGLLEDLLTALHRCEYVSAVLHPDIDDLLALRDAPPPRRKRKVHPPAAAVLTDLADRLADLDERRAALLEEVRQDPPDLTDRLEDLITDYQRLNADVSRIWPETFPGRAAERRRALNKVKQHLSDMRRLTDTSSPPRSSPSERPRDTDIPDTWWGFD